VAIQDHREEDRVALQEASAGIAGALRALVGVFEERMAPRFNVVETLGADGVLVEHKDRPSIESVFRDANRKHPDEWEDDTSFPPVNGVRVQRRKKKGPDWIKGVARQSSFGFVLLELDTQIQHSSEAREEPWGSVLSKLQANVEAVDASWERLRPQFARFSQGKCSCGPIRDMSRTGLVVAIGRLVLDADALPSTGVAIDPVPALGSSSSGERQVNHLIRRRVLEALGPFLVDLDLDLRHELDQVAALGDELYMPGSLRGRGEQSSTVPSDNSESVVETDDPQVDVNMLVRDGKVWTLRYSGRRVPLQDLKGAPVHSEAGGEPARSDQRHGSGWKHAGGSVGAGVPRRRGDKGNQG
jgi:hypothetical protein